MNYKITLSVFAVLILLVGSMFVLAKPDFSQETNTHSNGHATVTIPSHAVEVANGIFYLGEVVHNEKLVQGYAVFHHREGHNGGPSGNGGDTGGNTCYAFLSNGVKWNNVEDWVVNPDNNEGLTDSFILNNLGVDIAKWETESGTDILGSGSLTNDVLVADTSSPDNVNEIYFADVSGSGAIAVTIVWGVFRGPPSQRGLVEWDMVFDDVDFDWSSIGELGKMDFENIATHEIGHATGMGHPDNTCTEETMYAYAEEGETKKRDLNSGDIAGIQKLY